MVTDMTPSDKNSSKVCEVCTLTNQTRVSYRRKEDKKVREMFHLIWTDVCEMQYTSVEGFMYFITFKCDCCVYLWLGGLSRKRDTYDIVVEILDLVGRDRVREMRSDNGVEYMSDRIGEFLTKHRIIHNYTNAYTPEENSSAERTN